MVMVEMCAPRLCGLVSISQNAGPPTRRWAEENAGRPGPDFHRVIAFATPLRGTPLRGTPLRGMTLHVRLPVRPSSANSEGVVGA
jgi:hypothetical protein